MHCSAIDNATISLATLTRRDNLYKTELEFAYERDLNELIELEIELAVDHDNRTDEDWEHHHKGLNEFETGLSLKFKVTERLKPYFAIRHEKLLEGLKRAAQKDGDALTKVSVLFGVSLSV